IVAKDPTRLFGEKATSVAANKSTNFVMSGPQPAVTTGDSSAIQIAKPEPNMPAPLPDLFEAALKDEGQTNPGDMEKALDEFSKREGVSEKPKVPVRAVSRASKTRSKRASKSNTSSFINISKG
ncbi:MAG: hypothetical protein ABL949_14190, partial [Fimbriimonadaceae bacterium]